MTYAQAVEDGKTPTLAEYAKHAARGWGVLYVMRDASPDAPIPERLEGSTYDQDRLAEAEAAYSVARAMTLHEAAVAAEEEHATLLAHHRDFEAREQAKTERVQAMLAEVEAWEVSEEMAPFRAWLIEDLNRSLAHLAAPMGWNAPGRKDAQEYREYRIAKAEKDIEYHRERAVEQAARTEERDRWLAAFWNDLPKVEELA